MIFCSLYIFLLCSLLFISSNCSSICPSLLICISFCARLFFFFFPRSARSFHLYVSFKGPASSCLSVVSCLLPARVQGALGSPPCQYHPELRHKGLSLLLPSPLLGPLVHSLPLSIPFPLTLSVVVSSRESPIRNYVKTGSSPGARLKAVPLTCSEILTAIIIAYKSLRKFNYTKISWWKCAS